MNTPRFLPLLLSTVAMFGACKSAPIGYAPKPEDPLDGYKGTLQEAGANTEVDWGPKQEYLLSGYTTLRDQHDKLQKEFKSMQDENANLKQRLQGEGDSLTRERALRAQAEAEVASLQGKRRDLEARVLSLGIEKAKLEQAALLSKIADLQRALEPAPAQPGDTPAAPIGGRQ